MTTLVPSEKWAQAEIAGPLNKEIASLRAQLAAVTIERDTMAAWAQREIAPRLSNAAKCSQYLAR